MVSLSYSPSNVIHAIRKILLGSYPKRSMKYRKKPVVIDAFQLNERGLVGEDWFWDAVSNNDIITHDFGKFHDDPAWCEIKTLEGTMIARTGDYIIRGVNGEIYPCKPDIFEKTYEAIE